MGFLAAPEPRRPIGNFTGTGSTESGLFRDGGRGIGDLTDVCYAYENDNAKGDDINAASV